MAKTEQRLIDANALLKRKRKMSSADWGGEFWDEAVLVADIHKAPTVRDVVCSTWKFNKDGSGTCQNCHRHTLNCYDQDSWFRFCPSCGAEMIGGK